MQPVQLSQALLPPQPPGYLVAVHAGHSYVQENQVRQISFRYFRCVRGSTGSGVAILQFELAINLNWENIQRSSLTLLVAS